MANLTDADKVLRNDTGIDIATNIASIASALTPSNITDLGDVNLTNPITDGQVIKYDTATQKWINGLGNITMECTQAQYDAWKQSGQLKTNTLYVITDAPNLNATAQDISYDGGTDTVWDKVEALKWVDATAEFTKGSAFDTTQSSYILYNDALKMYAVSFAVKANSADNAVIFSSVPQLKNDIIVLPTGFANAGGLSVTQASCVYYKANNNIVLRISTTTNVPIFVTAFLLKA